MFGAVTGLALLFGLQSIGAPNAPPNQGRPECPQGGNWDSAFRSWSVPIAPVRELSGEITDIVEFHDCQQFIVPASGLRPARYSSLFAIFAADSLERLVDPASTSPGFREPGRPMATIFSYDRPYAPLGLRKGLSCLFFFYTRAASHQISSVRARIVPLSLPVGGPVISKGKRRTSCLQPLAATSAEGTALDVSFKVYPGQTLPPVARWDWDARRKQQYIGIRCETMWCEVHPAATFPMPAFTSSVSPFAPTTMPKGWYDEQTLAVVNIGGSGPTTVSKIRGTFIPEPDLGLENAEPLSSTFVNRWKQVARVGLQGNPGGYTSKFNLEESTSPSMLNRVALCFVPTDAPNSACFPTNSEKPICQPPAPGEAGRWYTRILSARSDRARYFCVTRRAHAGMIIPGTVRWRWLINDETMWIRCLQGCCEVNAA